jgi:8-oxo-dGTP pyrophosphatase MutT (NUDIX family)
MQGINTITFNQALQKRLKQPLPGKIAQQRMMPDIKDARFKYFSKYALRKAAVLIALFPFKNSIGTVLIERTQDASAHSGQIAFPGGKFEDADRNQIHTALREANEEVGVDIEKINVLGTLTPIEIPVSGFSVLPVVGWMNEKPLIIPSPDEVAHYYITSLIELLSPDNKQEGEILVRGEKISTPYYCLENTLVWGATAMLLSELEDVINDIF